MELEIENKKADIRKDRVEKKSLVEIRKDMFEKKGLSKGLELAL